jgi:hypothetical protein
MTLNNSILLVVKQAGPNGIEQNELLQRIASRYKSTASAKSALARSLKDMVSFGLIKKDSINGVGSKIFITDKGSSSISIEMKDKLILKLNTAFKRPLDSLDDITKFLVVLSTRANTEKQLLNSAKQNAEFNLSDLRALRKKIYFRRKELKKFYELIKSQEEKLRELDFNDSLEVPFTSEVGLKIMVYSQGNRITVETRDEFILSKIPELWKKQGAIVVEADSLPLLGQLLVDNPFVKANIYLPGIKVTLMGGKAKFFGPPSALKKLNLGILV